MQKIVLKKGEGKRFHIAIASIDKQADGSYLAILTLEDKRFPNARNPAGDIHVQSASKANVVAVVKEIAKTFPPGKDIFCLDLEVLKHGDE